MGKAKKKSDAKAEDAFPVDLKTFLAVKPEQRAKWIIKACKYASNGGADVKHLYDTLANKRVVQEVTDKKVGQRMLKALQDNVWVFSDKQQRYLMEDSALATRFAEKEESKSSSDEDAAPKKKAPAEDAAAKIEEMMARCRDFVREKADTFEDREKQAKLAEKQAAEARRREERERLRREWEQIEAWHKPLEEIELAWMAAHDEREGASVLEQRGKKRPAQESLEAEAKETEAKRDGSRKRDKDRDRDRERDRDRDRDRDRRRRRKNSSSSS